MNFIKKVKEKKFDEYVHLQFQKFSRGEFRERALITAKNSGGKFTISTGAEFANELAQEVAIKIGKNKINVKGIVVTTLDLIGQLDFKEKSQFQGVKKYTLDNEMSGEDIKNLIEKMPKVFFALSFSTPDGNTILKVKPKMPKTGKPKGAKEGEEGEIKVDFCKLITKDAELAKSFIFENPDFKEASIKHTFIIKDIVIPANLKNEKDFSKVREMALRKGVIIRQGKIDGKEIKSELEFEA